MSFLRALLGALAKRQQAASRAKKPAAFDTVPTPSRASPYAAPSPAPPSRGQERPEEASFSGPIAGQMRLPRDPALDRALGEPDELDAFLALPMVEQHKRLNQELRALPPHEWALLLQVLQVELSSIWLPMPGPQTQALISEADILLYGGAAGGGKSALLIGLAATGHHRSGIFRREAVELEGLVDIARDTIGPHASWNGKDNEFTFKAIDRRVRFGGMKEADDWRKYAGRARDFLGFDEAGEFREEQVASLIAWNRSTDPKQRCRVVLASNPPRGSEGAWLFQWFAPWLDLAFPSPAAPGELRWAVFANGDVVWIDDPQFGPDGHCLPVLIDGEEYTPKSLTFVPARLDDNPYLARTNYRATLQNLMEPLRSQLLKGDFLAGRQDDDWQVIPSAWIEAAQARWTPTPPPGRQMTSIAADSAEGGSDEFVLQPRYGHWFPAPIARKGVETSDSALMAGLISSQMRDGCEVVIDLGGGWGGNVYGHLKSNLDLSVTAYMGVNPSMARSQDGKMSFLNLRAEHWWKLREALDPQSGQAVALPPDPGLAADLASPRWKLRPGGVIQIESKADIRKRLGRSPDRGDAVVMAWAYGGLREMERAETQRQAVRANLGYSSAKRDHMPAIKAAMQPRVNLGYRHGRR